MCRYRCVCVGIGVGVLVWVCNWSLLWIDFKRGNGGWAVGRGGRGVRTTPQTPI